MKCYIAVTGLAGSLSPCTSRWWANDLNQSSRFSDLVFGWATQPPNELGRRARPPQ